MTILPSRRAGAATRYRWRSPATKPPALPAASSSGASSEASGSGTTTTTMTFSSPTTASTTPVSRARSLCVGVSFGDLVAMDSYDDDDDYDDFVNERQANEGPPVGTTGSRNEASRFLPRPAPGCAPAPPKQVVVRPELGGEPTPSYYATSEEEERAVMRVWESLPENERSQVPDPSMVTRHLRAEGGRVEKAAAKCRAALQWRLSFFGGTATDGMSGWADLLRRENATGKIYVRGYDKDGRALLYMRSARENTHNESDNMRHLVWNLEKAAACTRRKSLELGAKRPLEKVILVIDYENFSLRNAPPMSTSKFTLDVLQKHYPERLHRAYCVNAPGVFKTFWTLIKPWIDPHTKEKIVFVTTDDCQKLVETAERVDKLEPVVGGPPTARDFDSEEYLNLPFDMCFDED